VNNTRSSLRLTPLVRCLLPETDRRPRTADRWTRPPHRTARCGKRWPTLRWRARNWHSPRTRPTRVQYLYSFAERSRESDRCLPPFDFAHNAKIGAKQYFYRFVSLSILSNCIAFALTIAEPTQPITHARATDVHKARVAAFLDQIAYWSSGGASIAQSQARVAFDATQYDV
jgi:hypothetical protein